MLRNIRNDLRYCLSISESVGKIKLYSANCQNAESLYDLNEQLNFNASLTLLANIGDRISKFSDELRNKYQHIDWQKIRGFRNRIAHDYSGIDIFITFKIITHDLPELEQTMYEVIANELNAGNFDVEEYHVAKKSQYYRHVDFIKIDDKLLPDDKLRQIDDFC